MAVIFILVNLQGFQRHLAAATSSACYLKLMASGNTFDQLLHPAGGALTGLQKTPWWRDYSSSGLTRKRTSTEDFLKCWRSEPTNIVPCPSVESDYLKILKTYSSCFCLCTTRTCASKTRTDQLPHPLRVTVKVVRALSRAGAHLQHPRLSLRSWSISHGSRHWWLVKKSHPISHRFFFPKREKLSKTFRTSWFCSSDQHEDTELWCHFSH